MNKVSLASHLEDGLRDAASAHHALVEDMLKTGQSAESIKNENGNWYAFYAAYLSRRLAGVLGCMQVNNERESVQTPVAHPRVSWDNVPGIAELATEYSKLHVG